MAKTRTPVEQERIRQRKEFVQAHPDLDPAEARKRFYVQTRVKELGKSGVEVTKERRAALREKFISGGVQRAGFYTPKDLASSSGSGGSSGSSSTGGSTGGSTSGSAVPQTGGYVTNNPAMRKPIPGFKVGNVQKSTKKQVGVFDKGGKADQWAVENIDAPLDRFGDQIDKFRKQKGYVPVISDLGFVADKFNKGVFGVVKSTGESMAATFTNPTVNAVGKLFGKNPNLREAGPVEAAINTVGTVIDIATFGGSKPLTTALTTAARKTSTSLLKKNLVGLATTASNVAAKGQRALTAAEQIRTLRVSGLDDVVLSSGRKLKPPGGFPSKKYNRMGEVDYDLNSGVVADVVSAKKALLKPPGGTRSTARVKSRAELKAEAKSRVDALKTKNYPASASPTKVEPEFIPGALDSTPTFKNPVGTKTPRRKKVTSTETPGGPAVSVKTGKPISKKTKKPAKSPVVKTNEEIVANIKTKLAEPVSQAQLQAQADEIIQGGLAAVKKAVAPKKAAVPRKAPKSKTARVKKTTSKIEQAPYEDVGVSATGAKFKYPPSPWEERALAQAESARRQPSVAAPTVRAEPVKFKQIFKDQEDFNSWWMGGGKGKYDALPGNLKQDFIKRNQPYLANQKRTSAGQAAAAKQQDAKLLADNQASNVARGIEPRVTIPKSEQALRQPKKRTAAVKKTAAPKKSAAPRKKPASSKSKKTKNNQPTALANLLGGRG